MPPFDAGLVVRVVAVILAFLGLLGLASSLPSFESESSDGSSTSTTATAPSNSGGSTTPGTSGNTDVSAPGGTDSGNPSGPMGLNGFCYPAGTSEHVVPQRTITADGQVAPEVKQWIFAFRGSSDPRLLPSKQYDLPNGAHWCVEEDSFAGPIRAPYTDQSLLEPMYWKTEYVFEYDGYVAKSGQEADEHSLALAREGHFGNFTPDDYSKICLVERR